MTLVRGPERILALFLLALFLFTTINSTAIAANAPSTSSLIAQSEEIDTGDPLEPLNRAILEINEFFLALLIRPLVELYVTVLPDFVLEGIHNALNNLNTPVILANDILQWEPERAWQTTQRFFINSTIGIGGLMKKRCRAV